MKKLLVYLIASVLVLSACTTESVAPEVIYDSNRVLLGQELLVPAMQVCRLENRSTQSDVTIGFPMVDARLSSLGVVRAMVVYVDCRSIQQQVPPTRTWSMRYCKWEIV